MNPQDFIAEHVKNLPVRVFVTFLRLFLKCHKPFHLASVSLIFLPHGKFEKLQFSLLKREGHHTRIIVDYCLRKEITRYVSSFFGPEYDPQKEILVTVGVSEAIDIACVRFLILGTKYFTMNLAMFLMHLASPLHMEKLSLLGRLLNNLSHLILKLLKKHGSLVVKFFYLTSPPIQLVALLIVLNLKDWQDSQWKRI